MSSDRDRTNPTTGGEAFSLARLTHGMPRSQRKPRSIRKATGSPGPASTSGPTNPDIMAEVCQPTSESDSAMPQSDRTATAASAEEKLDSREVIQRLEELLSRFDRLDDRLDQFSVDAVDSAPNGDATYADSEELRLLRVELEQAWRDNEDLRQDNESLTAQLARASASQTIQSNIGVDESLSWEDRKAMIMAQMEADSFDADSFINSLSERTKACAGSNQNEESEHSDEFESEPTPLEFVESLSLRIGEMEETIRRRDQEISDLKNLLENQSGTWQSETRDSGIAIGAAAIAGLIDADPLVIEERARLQQLKDDWEDKFRQSEIEASLERAKLSRERQELAKRTQELEERLEELQRELKTGGREPAKGRRWLAELGLTPNSLSEAT